MLLAKESSSGAYAILEIFSKYFNVFSINFLKFTLFFRTILGSQQNWAGSRKSSHTPLPWHMHSLLHHQLIFHWCDTLVSVYELMLTHQYHLKSIGYIRLHSPCCTFYGFGQCIHHYSVIQKISLPWKPSLLNWFILPSHNHC